MPRTDRETLQAREFWRPSDAAMILGRGAAFWVRAFDDGLVSGYRDGKARGRYINSASARAYLDCLGAGQVEEKQAEIVVDLREKMREFRARWKTPDSGVLVCPGALQNHELESKKESA